MEVFQTSGSFTWEVAAGRFSRQHHCLISECRAETLHVDWAEKTSHAWLILAFSDNKCMLTSTGRLWHRKSLRGPEGPELKVEKAGWICEGGGEAHKMPRCIGSVPHSIAHIADLRAGGHGILDHALHDLRGVDHLS